MGNKYRAKNLRRVYIREWIDFIPDMTQAKLARKLETDKANVRRWINEPARIDLGVISDIEIALGLQPGDLFRHPREVTAERNALRAIASLKIHEPQT